MMGRGLILLAVFCGGLTPIFGRLLGQMGWSSPQICGVRGVIGTVILGCILRGRVWGARKAMVATGIMAISFTIGGSTYFYASQHAPVGLSVTLTYLGPVWVVLYDLMRGKGKLTLLLPVILGFGGVFFTTLGSSSEQAVEVWGVIAALSCSVIFAFFVIAGKKAQDAGVDAFVVAFWGLAFTTLAFGWAPFGAAWSTQVMPLLLATGIVSGILYLALLSSGLKRIESATEASILQYAEVVFAWMFASIFFHERARWNTLLGAVCIVGAGIAITLLSPKKERT